MTKKSITTTKRKTKIGKKQKPIVKNNNNNIHVALLYGGVSRERPVSLLSFDIFNEALRNLGYIVTPVDVGHDLVNVIATVESDVIVNGLYGTQGEDGYIPALLDMLGLKYTHSGVVPSMLGFDKTLAYKVFKTHGIRFANNKIISKKDGLKKDPMRRPYVIKPISEGSSFGVQLVFEEDDFDFANYEWKYGDTVIVEEYIPGKELQVAVLDGKAVGIMDIIPLKRDFYDYDSKYKKGFAEHIVPAKLDKQIEKHIFEISEKIHKAFGCKTMSRIDLRYDPKKSKEGVHVLEINTHPGMTSTSAFPEICLHHGITKENILEQLIKDALSD
jgi:D-alanine-D-alanine ligase